MARSAGRRIAGSCDGRRSGPESSAVYKWVNYTQANGFPAGEVFCVTVDGPRVWAGTEHGLVLLEDGRVKKVFTTADGMVSNAVMSVAVDKQTGRCLDRDLWRGQRILCRKFRNYTSLSSGLANDLVYGVAVQGKYVWLATTARGQPFEYLQR